MEALTGYCGGMFDSEGYSKVIEEEMEALEEREAVRKRAMEAASGIKER